MAGTDSHLHSRRWSDFEAAVRAAVAEPGEGDRRLADALPKLGKDRRVFVAAALGDASGPFGADALRATLAGEGSQDLKCAALLALAKRCGEAASDDLAQHAAGRVAAIKGYAILGPAGAGDDRAWDLVFAYLQRGLRRPRATTEVPNTLLVALAYLAQHLDGRGGTRTVGLVALIRGSWDRFVDAAVDERMLRRLAQGGWFEDHWPQCTPDGPEPAAVDPPDAAALRRWVRWPLFDPI